MSDVHPVAAEGFGRGADTYVRGRPDFPPAALDWLRHDLALQPGKAAIDLGAGTGKFTRLLVETGAEVIAVEPVTAMLDCLARELPAVRALPGDARQIPQPDAGADAVVPTKAMHRGMTAVNGAKCSRRRGSVSFIAALDATRRGKVLDAVRALIDATPVLVGRESVAFPYVTHAYWARAI